MYDKNNPTPFDLYTWLSLTFIDTLELKRFNKSKYKCKLSFCQQVCMSSMTSIREVAKRAGVSLGTVSNVLNRPEIVAEETRRRVQLVIEEIGFVPNGSARQLRAGRSQHIGLVVLDVANPFFTEVARGVEDLANQAGYVVILCNSDDSVGKESNYLHGLEAQRTQGVLITPVQSDARYCQRLRQRGIAVVLLDRPSRLKGLVTLAAIDDPGEASSAA